MYMKAGWATIQTSETVLNVLPSHDIIEHKNTFYCPCHPVIESQMANGNVYWTIIHCSFDEVLDEDQLEPYNGL